MTLPHTAAIFEFASFFLFFHFVLFVIAAAAAAAAIAAAAAVAVAVSIHFEHGIVRFCLIWFSVLVDRMMAATAAASIQSESRQPF